ncbi:DNA polymerase II [Aestuariirhabdus litorea]|uniref:DNA polymerase n=1 Tax=Aestuariirhabdus litorea TaxID=2528527 RepID=A0A3P3VPA2_9GAMM|nr:DNA polymerase II [Aestuariirhabdus litorea]RRJ84244.1 DNA polymerase II [Aestuariirhabdus litorea]RWW97466.1 DNA polymerase II [Endozoicomonadaceae bacterium GTF-13]
MTQPTHNAFLLTRQWRDTAHGLELTLWLKGEQGPVRAKIGGEKAVCFINTGSLPQALPQLSSLPGFQSRPLQLLSFEGQAITGCYFQQQRNLYRARDLLRKQQIELYEADIQPSDRFLMERFVLGALSLQGTLVDQEGFQAIQQPRVRARQLEKIPRFRVASIDIETDLRAEQLYSIAMVSGNHDQSPTEREVLMIGEGTPPPHTRFMRDERELIQVFCDWCHDRDPDLLIGWNLINFDLRVLQKRADALAIPFCIGRDGSALEWRQSRDNPDHFSLLLPGRVVLDGIDTLKSATWHFESFALDAVARELLERGKLIEHNDQRGEEIGRLFMEDKAALSAYNLEDCQLVWEIFAKTELIEFATRRACMTGLAMDRFGGSVAAFDHNYLPRLHRAGYIAPNLTQNPRGVGSPGGYVMDSAPGLYRNVLVLDFKSLYPSIIRTFMVDPLGLIAGLKADPRPANDSQHETDLLEHSTLVPGFNGALFSKEQSILPGLIEQLWLLRDNAKRAKNQPLSQAIKILMNSFYGVLGTPGCRFFDYRLPSSITLRGHQILTRSKHFIEQQGHRVIYGDTDSVFVLVEQALAAADARAIGEELARGLNQWWLERLQQEYGIKSHLEIEFETHFTHFLMPTIRGSEQGSKKRYAGIIEQEGKERLIFKGLETVRSDWTALARRFQRSLYWKIFHGEDYREFIQQTVADTLEGKHDGELVYRKRLRRPLSEYSRNIPPHAQAALREEEIRRVRNLPPAYQRGGWVEYLMTVKGAEPARYAESALDYERYIERQLEPIADGILHFLGDSFAEITGRQMGLF